MELRPVPSYLASRALVRVPISGKRAKPYESVGTSKCLAPYKLHAKSLAMLKTCEFLSLSRRYAGPHRLYSHNNSLLYQFSLTESLYLLAPALQPIDAAVLIQLLLLGESVLHTTLQIHMSFKFSVSLP